MIVLTGVEFEPMLDIKVIGRANGYVVILHVIDGIKIDYGTQK